jgi:isopentenyl-diphosphate delta-isomerase
MTAQIPAWVDGVLTPVEKLAVHQRGLRHKAVSVFVLNRGRVLIQQRALGKYHTPGLWANTCCTHPLWDESDADCATRRLGEELGITDVLLVQRDVVEYRADVGNGLTEHELAAIFVGRAADDLPVRPNPAEVMAVRWIGLDALQAEIAATPERFTPWLRIYLADHAQAILGNAVTT